ncbi:MAG: AarF/ABC1/UbiB kinase family protein [Candidatus Riflebacteria bacterium]|nr:AarF/ABC1/UbiB kinase family protein [Candidatus Riflebacteria bacterium]
MAKKNSFLFNPLNALKDFNRLREILTVLASHGFGQIIAEIEKGETTLGKIIASYGLKYKDSETPITTLAVRTRLVFQDLGPTFIKFGQILSTRPDLIPDNFTEELKKLQDNVPPFGFEEARALIESELKISLSDVFSKFDENPIGTASIGQVYRALLKSGEPVVIKVQRPNVRRIIESDIDLLLLLARILESRISQFKNIDLTGIINEFHKAIIQELDYLNELRNSLKFTAAFKDTLEIVIPRVYREFSTKKILTMEMIKGVKLNHAHEIGSDPKILVRIAIQAVLQMVFENGFFHADPHPGNIFALPGDRLAFLDLGMVGRLDEAMRYRLSDLILSLLSRDVEGVSRALLQMGSRKGKIDFREFTLDVGSTMDKFIGLAIEDIHFSEILRDLIDGARKHQIKIPNDYTMMGKALLTVEGLGRELVPDLNIEEEVRPFIKKLVYMRFSPSRIGSSLFKRVVDLYHWSNDLPSHVMTILDDLQSGNLKVQVEQADRVKSLENIEKIIGKLTAAMIVCSLIVSSALFITFSPGEYKIFGFPITLVLGLIGYFAAGLFGLKLLKAVINSEE